MKKISDEDKLEDKINIYDVKSDDEIEYRV